MMMTMMMVKGVWWPSSCKSGWGHTNFPLLSCHLLLKYSNSDGVFPKESQIIKALLMDFVVIGGGVTKVDKKMI